MFIFAAVIGRKGRAMERKLMKGFNIGRVEGIVNEILTESKKTSNIFGKLALAIGSKRKSVKTDWNAKVQRASMRRDQIGSSSASLSRSQASIRRRIQFENEQLLQTMNPRSITEYNPNVEQYSDQTKIAYAKFKMTNLQVEKIKLQKLKQLKATELSEEVNVSGPKQNSVQKPSICFENETKTKSAVSSRETHVEGQARHEAAQKEEKSDSAKTKSDISASKTWSASSATPETGRSPTCTSLMQQHSKTSTSNVPPKSKTNTAPTDASQKESTKDKDLKPKPPTSTDKSSSQSKNTQSKSQGTFSPTGKSQLTGQSRTGWI